MRRRVLLFILSAALLTPTGCRRTSSTPREGELLRRLNNPSVAYVAADNALLKQASAEARKTVPAFLKQLLAPRPNQGHFSVKIELREPGGIAEAVWLTGLKHDGKAIHGVVGNEPLHLRATHLGSKTWVREDQILDWMYVEDGRLHGGYTLRALREILVGDARVHFEQSMPFAFD
ncbi:MAG: DUF2314 domain-containing protein [Gemmataceae bacterium]|nr:DUF2314 domain-containing protein [Gemmataceae bacterium]